MSNYFSDPKVLRRLFKDPPKGSTFARPPTITECESNDDDFPSPPNRVTLPGTSRVLLYRVKPGRSLLSHEPESVTEKKEVCCFDILFRRD